MDQNLEAIFKAYDIRGKVGSELTEPLLERVGYVFSQWLNNNLPLVVGYDMRPDSKKLAEALCLGATKSGKEVFNIGMVTSDMAVFAIKHFDAGGAAIVTASHNPGEYNGVKLYDNSPKTIGLDQGLNAVRDRVLSNEAFNTSRPKGSIKKINIIDEWINFSLSLINKDQIPKARIAIDAGNGMAGTVLPKLLKRLPQLEVKPMYFEPDGTFPNHLANPQDIETLKDLQNEIKKNSLDFGIAFDGDGDRMAMVDETGKPISGSEMLSILAKKYLAKDSRFVHEVRTSRVVVTSLENTTGAIAVRSKSGRSNIGEIMTKNNAVFGGETTGHFFFKEYWNNDSGLMAMLIALEQIGKSKSTKLSELVKQNSTGFMIPETNFKVKDPDLAIKNIGAAFADNEQDYLDGLSVSGKGWWFNIRKSNTEPLIRLNAETSKKIDLQNLLNKVSNLMN